MIGMAVKRTKKMTTELPAPAEVVEPQAEVISSGKKRPGKIILGIFLAVLLLVLYWYKTNTWPIVAVVGLRPITRFEVNQLLFKQGGKTIVEDLVTEILVKNELSKNKINVSDNEVNNKMSEIRNSLGTTLKLEDVLAQRNMTLEELKNQVKIQMSLEKLLSDKISVTDAEILAYLNQNQSFLTSASEAGKKNEAYNAIRLTKMQSEVDKLIKDLKAKNDYWKAPGI